MMNNPSDLHAPRPALRRLSQLELLNFVLTNRLPRVSVTLLMGRISAVESPWLTRRMLWLWKLFGEIDEQSTEEREFESLRAFFTRGLKPGARPIDQRPGLAISPCDGITGAYGQIEKGAAMQIKGMPYSVGSLLKRKDLAKEFEGGHFLTIRLTAGMYHRFHAPMNMRITRVIHIQGDSWNVNPPSLKRVPALFCRNTRAILECEGFRDEHTSFRFLIVAVGAILVSSIRLHGLNETLSLKNRVDSEWTGNWYAEKGQELGWFEQGSTLVLLTPNQMNRLDCVETGTPLKMGQPLFRLK